MAKDHHIQRLLKAQQYYQSSRKHTYLKGPYDMVFSVAIPLAFTAAIGYYLVRDIYRLANDLNK